MSCACEFKSSKEQVACYLNYYRRFLIRRGRLTANERSSLYLEQLKAKYNCVADIIHEDIVCRNVTHLMTESIILRTFLRDYCKEHPRTTSQINPSNFTSKIDLFSNA